MPPSPAPGPLFDRIELSPDEATLAIAMRDWRVIVFDLHERRVRRAFQAPGQVMDLTWAGPTRLAAITHTSAVVWDVNRREEAFRFYGDEHTAASPLGSLRLDHDARRLAYAPDPAHGTIEIRDATYADGSRVLRRLDTGVKEPARITWVDDDRAIVVEGADGFEEWDASTGVLRGGWDNSLDNRAPTAEGRAIAFARRVEHDLLSFDDFEERTTSPTFVTLGCPFPRGKLTVAIAADRPRAVVATTGMPPIAEARPIGSWFDGPSIDGGAMVSAMLVDTTAWRAIVVLPALRADEARFSFAGDRIAAVTRTSDLTRVAFIDPRTSRIHELTSPMRFDDARIFGRHRFLEMHAPVILVRNEDTGSLVARVVADETLR